MSITARPRSTAALAVGVLALGSVLGMSLPAPESTAGAPVTARFTTVPVALPTPGPLLRALVIPAGGEGAAESPSSGAVVAAGSGPAPLSPVRAPRAAEAGRAERTAPTFGLASSPLVLREGDRSGGTSSAPVQFVALAPMQPMIGPAAG